MVLAVAVAGVMGMRLVAALRLEAAKVVMLEVVTRQEELAMRRRRCPQLLVACRGADSG